MTKQIYKRFNSTKSCYKQAGMEQQRTIQK